MLTRTPMLLDSLYNLVSGLGTSKDPTTALQYQLRLLSRADVENAYRGDWVARKIVNAPADDATREWRQWNAKQDQIDALEATEKTHAIQRKTRDALIRSRLYGGAALVFAVNGQDPAEELDLEAVGEGDLEFVVVMNRYELMAGPRIFNVDSPFYTRPEYYTVATPIYASKASAATGDLNRQMTPPTGMMKIHPSRVVEFVGNELPDWRLIPMGGGWGDSVLQSVDDVLRDIGLVVGGIATMVNDAKVDVIKIPDFSKSIATTEYANRLLSRFSYANMAKSTVNSILLDAEEEWQRVQTQFGGLPNLLHEYLVLAAGAAEIPVSRLIGQAAGRGLGEASGMSASGGAGDAEVRAYYDRITSQQKNTYSPAMAPLDEVILRTSLGSFDPTIHYEWRPLWTMDEATKAKIALDKANSTKIDVETGLINEDALRDARVQTLLEDGTYVGLDDAIEEHGAEPEEEDIEVPWSRLAGAMATITAPKGAGGAAAAALSKGGPDAPKNDNNGKAFESPEQRQAANDAGPSDEPRDKDGKWTAGGGGQESKHPTHPLPDSPGSTSVFDVPDEDHGSLMTKVIRKPDGSYYGDTGEFDFAAPNAAAMRAKLQKWGAKHAGWEHRTRDSAPAKPRKIVTLRLAHDAESARALKDRVERVYAADTKPAIEIAREIGAEIEAATPSLRGRRKGETLDAYRARFFGGVHDALAESPDDAVIVADAKGAQLLRAWAKAGFADDGALDEAEMKRRPSGPVEIDVPMKALARAGGRR